MKYTHEIRDPIHAFVRLDTDERRVLDSRAFQRLRNIHQLALTYLVYPGATHKRFEHSIGVMELAGRVYDVITEPENIRKDAVREIIPKYNSDAHRYWRKVLRMAALCHDIGHLPFSHAAEHELLPEGVSHEDLTAALIRSPEMPQIWSTMEPPLTTEHIVKLAVGQKKLKETRFSVWESILSEIIVGDAFGVDRIDYLLRDSLHTGVGYGRFDHHRLVETLRMLPGSDDPSAGQEPLLGIEEGGLRAAEGLLVARYFMYSQVYFHPVRRVYDKHLKDFMIVHYGARGYPTDITKHVSNDDNIILEDMHRARNNTEHKGHDSARRIAERDHFRLIYTSNPADNLINPEAPRYIAEAVKKEFGDDNTYYDAYTPRSGGTFFPVMMRDERIIDSTSLSSIAEKGLGNRFDYIFVNASLRRQAEKFVTENRAEIIKPRGEG